MDASLKLAAYLNSKKPLIGRVVDFDAAADRLLSIDLTENNTELSAVLTDANSFSAWVDQQMAEGGYRYGAGGYMENRTIYNSRNLFTADEAPRSLHLGVDIWAPAGTAVYAPLDGIVHSFNDNDNYGDYGPTIILQHDLDGLQLFSLYGHLSRKNLDELFVGQAISINQKIGDFGSLDENGHWPPHLHFQLMLDMEGKHGDYPGVCSPFQKQQYLKNIPDPNLLLQFPLANSR
ncbi:MAG: peptidase M23 [Sphingobacteriales bacterium]|nr:MAG: peptidase M23 [Sphingobacteriales bacterium]